MVGEISPRTHPAIHLRLSQLQNSATPCPIRRPACDGIGAAAGLDSHPSSSGSSRAAGGRLSVKEDTFFAEPLLSREFRSRSKITNLVATLTGTRSWFEPAGLRGERTL